MRILLAEDEVSIADFIQEGLEEEGFAVDMAHNGKEGLRMALDNLEEYDYPAARLDASWPERHRNLPTGAQGKPENPHHFPDGKGQRGRCGVRLGSWRKRLYPQAFCL